MNCAKRPIHFTSSGDTVNKKDNKRIGTNFSAESIIFAQRPEAFNNDKETDIFFTGN